MMCLTEQVQCKKANNGNCDEHHLYEAKTNKFDTESAVVTSL